MSGQSSSFLNPSQKVLPFLREDSIPFWNVSPVTPSNPNRSRSVRSFWKMGRSPGAVSPLPATAPCCSEHLPLAATPARLHPPAPSSCPSAVGCFSHGANIWAEDPLSKQRVQQWARSRRTPPTNQRTPPAPAPARWAEISSSKPDVGPCLNADVQWDVEREERSVGQKTESISQI